MLVEDGHLKCSTRAQTEILDSFKAFLAQQCPATDQVNWDLGVRQLQSETVVQQPGDMPERETEVEKKRRDKLQKLCNQHDKRISRESATSTESQFTRNSFDVSSVKGSRSLTTVTVVLQQTMPKCKKRRAVGLASSRGRIKEENHNDDKQEEARVLRNLGDLFERCVEAVESLPLQPD